MQSPLSGNNIMRTYNYSNIFLYSTPSKVNSFDLSSSMLKSSINAKGDAMPFINNEERYSKELLLISYFMYKKPRNHNCFCGP